ncbi:phage tail protein [Paenibacillus daejeonensis]|uniref:phage tail protein n=1 Tax=Paenibacillus daejeonensis TaxID=135193 RepID=UPI0003729E23|nr:phage tail protein [Paenibacillus daejeonensis]
MIGSFGPLIFTVSDKTVRTFTDFRRSSSARWATHEIYGRYPRPQYIGPGQDEITFGMRFDVSMGVKPRNELSKLTEYCRTGRTEKLIVGGVPMGAGKWYIETVGQEWQKFDGKGTLLVAAVDVTLKEYV